MHSKDTQTQQQQGQSNAEMVESEQSFEYSGGAIFEDNRPESRRGLDLHSWANAPSRGTLQLITALDNNKQPDQKSNLTDALETNQPVIQRLINIHDVNQAPPNAPKKKDAKYTHNQAQFRKDLRTSLMNYINHRFYEELEQILGPEFDGTNYVGKNDQISLQIKMALHNIWKKENFNGPEEIETMRQQLNTNIQTIEKLISKENNQNLPALSLNTSIGNEFTFTNQTLINISQRYAEKKGNKDKIKENYDKENTPAVEAIIDRWGNYLLKTMAARDRTGKNKPEKKPNQGIKITKGKDHKGKKIRVEFPSLSWHYDVTVDQACVEVITPPTPAKELVSGEKANLIDQYIFNVAKTLDLHAHAEYGGGHINIDRAAFESKGTNLATFLEGFMDDSEFWKELDSDYYNAAFPDEYKPSKQEDFQKIIERYKKSFSQKDANVSKLNSDLSDELKKSVFNENLANEKKSLSVHYQAVNLEHFDEDDENARHERRVEVRRVAAQKNRMQLLNQLDRIFALIKGEDVPEKPQFEEPKDPVKKEAKGVNKKKKKKNNWANNKKKKKKAPPVEEKKKKKKQSGNIKLSANDVAAEQVPTLHQHHLQPIPILGDGNCFFNAVIRSANLATNVQKLRTALADAVQTANSNGTIGAQFPFVPIGSLNDILGDLRTNGSYDNLAGDLAPQIFTTVYNTYRLRIIQEDGNITDVGAGASDVWLIRTTHSVDHYLATKSTQ